MGHERIGFLPRTEPWKQIINQLSQYNGGADQILKIADQTLTNIQSKYKSMPNDESVIKALKFLTLLTYSANSNDQAQILNDNGININNISLYNLARSAKEYISTTTDSLETNQIARDSLLETLTKYESSKNNGQALLFAEPALNIWNKAGNGAEFCELARGFIASFTERYLKYYLEREAAHAINDYKMLDSFSSKLNEQAEQISHHAFDTAKLMQSFAAGWYNVHVKTKLPDDKEINGFLRHTFDKMREEFRREAENE
jgi:hypothetical protein